MKQELFAVDPGIIREQALAPEVQVLFHAMNKSGSLAISEVLHQAYVAANRKSEFLSHFQVRANQPQFNAMVNDLRGGGLVIDHYLYGGPPPRPGRVLITQVRHPLSRMLSAYNWLKKRSPQGEANFPEFKKWIKLTRGVSHSLIIQLGLNWRHAGTEAFRQAIMRLQAPEVYERAMNALEREIFAVGVAEYFEESIFMYAKLLRLAKVPAWQRDKRNEDRPLSTDIDREAIELVEHVNRHDYLFYAAVVERFWTQFDAPERSERLQAYKQRCSGEYRDRLVHQQG